MSSLPASLIFRRCVGQGEAEPACAFIARHTGLSKSVVKDAMIKGAVLLRRGKAVHRLRRATRELLPGDMLEFHYAPELLARAPPLAVRLADEGSYSVWIKPPGLMAQGNEYGDHCSLLRAVECRVGPKRAVFLVHRLDREAAGLMVVAHTRHAAASLSKAFQEQRVLKRYRVRVCGDVSRTRGSKGVLNMPLDGKSATTEFAVVTYDPLSDVTTLEITLRTGRLHQIRRHCALVNHPVKGDPRYGRDNEDPNGLQLWAVELKIPDVGAGSKHYRWEPASDS